jgi:hypothetical protein
MPKSAHNTLAMCIAVIAKSGGMNMTELAANFADDIVVGPRSFAPSLIVGCVPCNMKLQTSRK